jgi:hypothetical protein
MYPPMSAFSTNDPLTFAVSKKRLDRIEGDRLEVKDSTSIKTLIGFPNLCRYN